MKTVLSSCVLIAVVFLVVGCDCGLGGKEVQPVAQKTVQPTPPAPAAPVAKQLGPNELLHQLPCADCGGVIRIEKVMPKQVNVNSPFEYHIVVTNLTDMGLEDVVVTERLADNFKYAGSKPTAKQDKQMLEWTVPTLGPKASKTFVVTGTAAQAGEIVNCTNATYNCPGCATTQVLQPQLALAHTAPNTKVICDEIEVKITVKNQGTGLAENVKISAPLPDGLTAGGARTLDINVGTLGAGEAKAYVAKLKAAKTGTYDLQAVAVADGNLSAKSAATATAVTQPVLTVTKTGPQTQYLGRRVEYTITVANKGNSAAMDTVVEDTLPGDIDDIRVTDGGVKTGSTIKWNLGALAEGTSKKLSVSYMPTKAATLGNKATAKAYCVDAVSASAQTVVKGIPALLLEVIDLTDPIEVGGTETYRIVVTNQGSAVATKTTINCPLEAEFMQFVSASGATQGQLSGNVVTFAPLPTLAPKAKATWEVRVKALKAGDVRFKVNMNSDQLGRDVEETESTNFYQ